MENRLQIGMLALLPYACIGAIIQYCHKNKDCSLGDQLEVTPLQRKSLLVHLAYFIGVPIMIEVFPDLSIIDALVGPTDTSFPTTNVQFMLSCLAAENFFVTSTALGMIVMQDSVPRWSLMAPFAQLAWNLKNHLSWYFLADGLAPQGPLPFALADMVIIWPVVAIYGHHFFTAKKVQKKD